MAQEPINPAHALRIQAGILGRKTGHSFEDRLADEINSLAYPLRSPGKKPLFVATGNPARLLVAYVAAHEGIRVVRKATAISTGALATSEEGKRWLSINGFAVSRSKSDIVLTIARGSGSPVTRGISTKQCSNEKPTNAQMYFTTATGFGTLLNGNGIPLSDAAIDALRRFCGEVGFRPMDSGAALGNLADPSRFFWEELDVTGREELIRVLTRHQRKITRLLLKKGYPDDPFAPEYLVHKTKTAARWDTTEVAIFSIDQLVRLSYRYQRFQTATYTHKGHSHLAPRFGIVQMQRAGQKQHPTQLQFNLEAGYFYKF